MSTDIKLNKNQLPKIIQMGGFLGKTLGKMMSNIGKKALIDLAVPLAKDVLPNLATETTSSVLDKFERKISVKGEVRAEKGFTLPRRQILVPRTSPSNVLRTSPKRPI